VRRARQRSALDDVVVNALERHSHRLEELIGQAIEEQALDEFDVTGRGLRDLSPALVGERYLSRPPVTRLN